MSKTKLQFAHHPHPSPVPADKRAELLKNPGFGRVFSDHMVTIRYHESKGWHDARIEPRAPIAMDPAAAVLHYAQEIFEGLKAYRTKDGGATMFRPIENARRFQQSAERLAMPSLPEELFVEACDLLVKTDRAWIPDGDGSLYIRPFMFANETFLGVKPSSDYLFIVIASSVGSYFKSGADAVSVWVSQEFTRAAPGGTGAVKCGGNYAASLLAQAEATRNGCDQVVFLDAAERKWVEELGGMNIFFVFNDGSMSTPPLGGTILAGVTRDCVLQLLRDWKVPAVERPLSLEELATAHAARKLDALFGTGTASLVAPIGEVAWDGASLPLPPAGPDALGERLRGALGAVQRGEAPDLHGWLEPV